MEGCFSKSMPNLGPMFTGSLLCLVPASALVAPTACTAAFAVSIAAWVMLVPLPVHLPLFCFNFYICFKILIAYFPWFFILTPCNVACLKGDNISGYFICVFMA